jgi:esterase/lipase
MKKILIILILLFTFFIITVYGAGSYLTKAKPTEIGAIPRNLKNIRAVSFFSKSGSQLSGWLLEAKQGKGGILLLHGVKSNRLQMLNRAKFLQQAGYDVLLFDFQAHGESRGEQITFGYLESLDANTAYEYLADRVCNPSIGVIGVSLGGVSVLLGDVSKKAKVLILESVYPTIKEAISDRFKIYFGSFGSYLTPLLTLQIKPRLGIGIEKLRPIDHVKNIEGAVMFVIGSKDRHSTVLESKQMYLQAKEPKELWIIDGAGHANFDKFLGEEYNRKILNFLEEWMD